MNVVCYERVCYERGLLRKWSVMNGSVMNVVCYERVCNEQVCYDYERGLFRVVCYEWSVMSRSLLNGHLKGLFYSGNEVQRRQPTENQGTCCDRLRSM